MLQGISFSTILGFQSKPTPTMIKNMIGEFLRTIPKDPLLMVKLKILVTCHVILGDFTSGKIFAH
jgi:hypothetical protein